MTLFFIKFLNNLIINDFHLNINLNLFKIICKNNINLHFLKFVKLFQKFQLYYNVNNWYKAKGKKDVLPSNRNCDMLL